MDKNDWGPNVLVLWRWEEAGRVKGEVLTGSIGNQMRGIRKGDTLYVCSTTGNELYILGAIAVNRIRPEPSSENRRYSGSYRAEGRNLSGPFQKLPLARQKWKLRFENTQSKKLSPESEIAFQVRAHRFLTPESAKLLTKILSSGKKKAIERFQEFKNEGRKMEQSVSLYERDSRIRRAALLKYGYACAICKVDFARKYRNVKFRSCMEVHHLDPLASRMGKATQTTLDGVRVVCPNCHRALHRASDPSDIEKFKQECGL